VAIGALTARRPRSAAVGFAGWLGLTAEFAVRRILPGPRTPAEIATMIITSAAIPPVALVYRAAGELRVRRAGRNRPIRAVLLDRDGTLIHDVGYLADPDRVTPVEGAREAIADLRKQGLLVGVVSNQSGVGRGLIRKEQLSAVNDRVDALLGPFDTWQTCPHSPEAGCPCRKPRPGLVLAAAQDLGVEPSECLVIGDIGADVQAALRAGARAVLVPTPVTRPGEVAHAREFAAVATSLTEAVGQALAGAR
jgi:histidinol-phosphate phosphatase family protein